MKWNRTQLLRALVLALALQVCCYALVLARGFVAPIVPLA